MARLAHALVICIRMARRACMFRRGGGRAVKLKNVKILTAFIASVLALGGCASVSRDLAYGSTDESALLLLENAYELPGQVMFVRVDLSSKRVVEPGLVVGTDGDHRLQSDDPSLALPVGGLEGLLAVKGATRFSVASTPPGDYALLSYSAFAGATQSVAMSVQACAGLAAPVFRLRTGVVNIVMAEQQPMHRGAASPRYRMSSSAQDAVRDAQRIIAGYPRIVAPVEVANVVDRVDFGSRCSVGSAFMLSGSQPSN